VRPARREDIPALARLAQACDRSQTAWAGPGIPIPGLIEEELEWDLRFARTGAWIVVVDDDERPGEIAATTAYAAGTVSREDRTLVPGLAHVNAVFVHPDRWRRGLARTLLAAADDAMVAAGFDRAQLWTLEGSPAEHLYRNLGWAPDGRREIYPPLGLDIVAYVKTLAAPRS
jgi:GNAT superfamily N-acetyltransferase